METLVTQAADKGLTAMALADRGALYGVPALVRACRQAGIKPIIGCSFALGGGRLILIARSPEGYRSLCRFVTQVRTGSAAPLGERWTWAELPDTAASGLTALISDPSQAPLCPAGCPTYVMLDAGAPQSRNQALLQAGGPVIAVDTGAAPLSRDRLSHLFSWCPEALGNADALELACADSFPAPAPRLPRVPGNIRDLARRGLEERYSANVPYDRLERELSVIASRGQFGYFLALWDLVRYAREQGIPVGPGRGSAVGSLTAYALGITDVDPIAHGLYFERFLNPERPDLPDIDLDVCSLGRPRLIQYLRERYGDEHVAMVGVIARLGPRGAVREAGRRLGTPKELVDMVAKALPQDGSIADAVRTLPEFRYLHVAKEPLRSLLATAADLEARPWHSSVHAAGVVISPEPLAHLVPLERTGGGEIVTQYSSGDLEELGLVKIDILGLRNLTIIAEACGRSGTSLPAIPRDDRRTFSLLAGGDTLGVFQLDSPGIRGLLRQVRPERMEDLITVLSLYRPGPSQSGAIQTYCRRRQGQEKVRYLHPCLEPILGETLGLILYQEQVMRLAHEVGNLSLAGADELRRALAAGDASRFRRPFIDGAVTLGIPAGVARQVFGLLEQVSGYSFNKAHTAAYAQISYVTAYLKAHHPAAYFAALLTHESGYFRPDVYLREAERLGVALLPPHVNWSHAAYTAETPGSIRVGLLQIQGLGAKTTEAILHARDAGPFATVADFAARIPSALLSSRVMDALMAQGCFAGLPDAPGPASVHRSPRQMARPPGQLTLFDLGLGGEQGSAEPPARSQDEAGAPAPGRAGSSLRLDRLTDGRQVRITGAVITCQRRPVRERVGLSMLLQVGPEQVSVLVPPDVYARDLLSIDPAGVTVEGRVRRIGADSRILASAILPAV